MNVAVTQDLSVVSLIANASILVQLVMLGLLLASLFSWYYIFRKYYSLRRAHRQTDEFERDFWSGGNLNELYQAAVNARHGSGSLERIFESGYREFSKLRRPGHDIAAVIDGVEMVLKELSVTSYTLGTPSGHTQPGDQRQENLDALHDIGSAVASAARTCRIQRASLVGVTGEMPDLEPYEAPDHVVALP